MSVRQITRAYDYGADRELAPTRRLVLITLADGADDAGRYWPSQQRLALLTGLSKSTIRQALREFEELGILKTIGRSRDEGRGRTSNLYILSLSGSDPTDEQPPSIGVKSPGPNADPATTNRRMTDDQPPTVGGDKNRQEPSGTVDPPLSPPRELPTVSRKRVTADEYRLASAILAAFNGAAETTFTVDAHLTPVIGRIREHLELDADQHSQIIAAAFGRPWWKGPPGPEVIYGNAAQFERCIEAWRRNGAGAGRPKRVRL